MAGVGPVGRGLRSLLAPVPEVADSAVQGSPWQGGPKARPLAFKGSAGFKPEPHHRRAGCTVCLSFFDFKMNTSLTGCLQD